jgi:hypothetical protein
LRGEEIIAEVERTRRARRLEPHTVLLRDVGETARNIRPSGEDDAFDFGADRRQCGPHVVAAIEQR